jgi:hypothetical protein
MPALLAAAAVLGFVAALVAETHGDSLFAQLVAGGFESALAVIALVTLASFAPAVRQVSASRKSFWGSTLLLLTALSSHFEACSNRLQVWRITGLPSFNCDSVTDLLHLSLNKQA